MKSTISFSIICLSLFWGLSFSSCKQKEQIPALLERKVSVKGDPDKNLILDSYNKAKMSLEKNPDDVQQYINLANAFVAEGRITGNSGYYNDAALQMLEKVTANEKATQDHVFQALTLQSTILLNYHQFKDALQVAEKGVAINNYNSGIYGALIDASVELGDYDKAVQYCDKMLTLRPDLRSYSRASYLRQIHGDNRGAIQAMMMAVEAGIPGAENTEWARTTLGDLYLNTGNPDSASLIYRTSLVYRPGYPFALIGMAKVAKVKKDYTAAIAHTKEAIQAYSDASFVLMLADLFELQGDTKKAAEVRSDVIALVEDGRKEEAGKKTAKHNVNRELATAYLQAGQLDKALEFAGKDLEMRPRNIDANDLMAWIYFKKGEYAKASEYTNKVFVTNIRNAEMLYKAATIYAKAGMNDKSAELMKTAMAVNPYVNEASGNTVKYAAAITKM